jgi:hypothetical protein
MRATRSAHHLSESVVDEAGGAVPVGGGVRTPIGWQSVAPRRKLIDTYIIKMEDGL